MTIHVDKVFESQAFIVEEVALVRCKLSNCDLFYSGGDYDWIETEMNNCRFHWRGPAGSTVKLLEFLGALGKPRESGMLDIQKTKVN